MGVMEIFVSVSNISNILSKIVQNPCVLYSDHYVANLCLFFIKRTNILIKQRLDLGKGAFSNTFWRILSVNGGATPKPAKSISPKILPAKGRRGCTPQVRKKKFLPKKQFIYGQKIIFSRFKFFLGLFDRSILRHLCRPISASFLILTSGKLARRHLWSFFNLY